MASTSDRDIEHFDVIIVGSGPAGISTALHLLKLDRNWRPRLLVLEKGHHPRHKLCGGGLTRLGIRTLQELGLQFPLPLPQVYVKDVRLLYRNRTIHVRGDPQFIVFHRLQFDAFLAKLAVDEGISIRQEEAVSAIRDEGGHVIVETNQKQYACQVLVGADGSNGIVRRALHIRERPSHTARLLEINQPASFSTSLFQEQGATFDFNPVHQDLQGYYWDFPAQINGNAAFNRGVYDARVYPNHRKAKLAQILAKSLGEEKPAEPASIMGNPIHWWSPSNTLSRPHVILVGDAAGAEPLFGEGIGPALAYGKLAAEAIQSAFKRQDFSFHSFRRRLLTSELGGYLLIRWLAAKLAYNLGGVPGGLRALWLAGKWVARFWPAPPPLKNPDE